MDQAENNRDDDDTERGTKRPMNDDRKEASEGTAAKRGRTSGGSDPLITLSDLAVEKVLSFLVGSDQKHYEEEDAGVEETLRLQAAGKQLLQLQCISKLWNQRLNKVIGGPAFGLLPLDLFEVQNYIPKLIQELCRDDHGILRGIALSRLWIRYAELGDIPLLKKLIRSCKTGNLTRLQATVNKGMSEEAAHSAYAIKKMNDVIDLDSDSDETGVCGLVHAREQKGLHDLIAKECPNLTELDVTVILPANSPDYTDYISHDLFSMPSIEHLTITLGFHHAVEEPINLDSLTPIDSNILAKLTEGLPALKTLKVATARKALEHCKWRRFHVSSRSLERIDATDFGEEMVISCNCPKLQTFTCLGKNVTILPHVTRERWVNRDHQQMHLVGERVYGPSKPSPRVWEHRNCFKQDMVTTGGYFSFPNLNVPNTCQITIKGFLHWERYETYVEQYEIVSSL